MSKGSAKTAVNRRSLLAASLATGLAGTQARAQVAKSVAYDWQTIPFGGGGFVPGFVFHPKEKDLLYARTDVGGAYRFDSAVGRWLPLLDFLGHDDAELMGVLSVALDAGNPDKVYLACGLRLDAYGRDGAVLCSSDRGATWSMTALGNGVKLGGNAPGRGTGERLQVDPNQGDILFLGTNQNGLMKSSNSGKSFSALGFPSKTITLVLFDAKSGKPGSATPVVYAGSGEGKGGLYKSSDGGGNFALLPGLPDQFPQRAAIDADGNLYVSFSSGLTPGGADSGSVWCIDAAGKARDISPAATGGGNNFAYCGLDIDPNRPGTIVVSTMNRWAQGDDIYLSRDGGRHWKPVGPQAHHDVGDYHWLFNYLKSQEKMGHWIADVKIDPHNSDRLIYGTGFGLWQTRNLGQIDGTDEVTFTFDDANFEETVTLGLLSPSGGAILLAAMGDVSGAAYDDLSKGPQTGLFAPCWETNRSVAFAELAPQYIVRTADQAKTSGYWSGDGGASWTPFASSPRVERDAKGNWHGSGVIAISAKGTSLVWVPEKEAAFFSLDKGKTWKESAGWPVTRDVGLEAVADRAVDGIFYVLDRAGQNILISVDAGASFQPNIRGLPKIETYQHARLFAAPGRL
ncbi:MAG TPA: exo-alpha-sialidase, partial [Asticcacaulis sp.]|nr:exo-alpha-sialidase [Asticcacaulis sp.]